ncbi:MAG TPA: winged helix-turn-helix domain-containing protein [Chloroflexota bacterium]|nr:winged helix-turn-helix domain-containing protein [Chloroflexota bacterium]
MRAGRLATLNAARRYLGAPWDTAYGSLNRVWWQLRKQGVRPKTGRRRHAQADPAAQEAFRRGFLDSGAHRSHASRSGPVTRDALA